MLQTFRFQNSEQNRPYDFIKSFFKSVLK
jgi:hypothetical protein